jgi:hypothetical protein
MLLSSPPFHERPHPIARQGDYLRLGLRRGECSSPVIRSATHSAVQRLVGSPLRLSSENLDRQLGLLATSAYRLLDPRYRLQLYERVQLSYSLERNEVEPTAIEDLMTIPNTIIDGDRRALSPAEPAASSTTGWQDAIDSLDHAREVVRMIRGADGNQGNQGHGWMAKLLRAIRGLFANR